MLSFLGGSGVEGGQGPAEHMYGSVDDHDKFGTASAWAPRNPMYNCGDLFDP
eukprot:CAMPEP_0175804456 /NCGR_PEP_ID=MMETSP0107_2-20121207/127_1 /TAXON_ID=195067 ORGANISM="Goniomonas pacifica, Strain CCMP1869" /NCGR_SAMPLE_ID=MMETSP0107_2 /ASSEMBLY_ACC=CAM_ASM_000203 /LENGTH=51 /DNA_ID=CAMNT_0017115801 /DNA_START=299 /DNA_END=454 /DNA_ORIENTATION=+